MHACNLFDRYRDGELESSEREEFQTHLSACEGCRLKATLLNNLVQVLQQEELRPRDLAAQIARMAFLKRESWAGLVVSWLRPGPAWAVLSIALILFSLLFMMPVKQTIDIYAEYERLMDEVESVGLETNAGISQSRSEMEQLLAPGEEGIPQ